jgi:uncharacterized integral membrane protein
MRYIRYGFLLALGLILVTLAFANREPVTLRLLPDDLERFWSWGRVVTLPLFLVIFGAIIAGVALGFVWEWMREYRIRADAGRVRREKDALRREVDRLKGSPDGPDEILRLLEKSGAGR